MKKFVSLIISLFAILMIQAQQISLDKTNVQNTCVVQQHIDVGTTIPTIYTIIAKEQVAVYSNSGLLIMPNNPDTGCNRLAYTSYIDYRRGVGLINNEFNTIYSSDKYAGGKWMNVQRYWTISIG